MTMCTAMLPCGHPLNAGIVFVHGGQRSKCLVKPHMEGAHVSLLAQRAVGLGFHSHELCHSDQVRICPPMGWTALMMHSGCFSHLSSLVMQEIRQPRRTRLWLRLHRRFLLLPRLLPAAGWSRDGQLQGPGQDPVQL